MHFYFFINQFLQLLRNLHWLFPILRSVSPPLTGARARGHRAVIHGQIGRAQARAAPVVHPGGGWQCVDAFGVRTPTKPSQLSARNSDPIDYFVLLFTVATMRTVLGNTRSYAEVVLCDLAGWSTNTQPLTWSNGPLEISTWQHWRIFLGCTSAWAFCAKKKCVGLLVTKESVTVYSVLCTCHVVPQICTDATSVSCWYHPQACGQPNFDPWNKVRPVLDAVNQTFKMYFVCSVCQ